MFDSLSAESEDVLHVKLGPVGPMWMDFNISLLQRVPERREGLLRILVADLVEIV